MDTAKKFSYIGFFVTSIFGTVSHFFYEWSNYNVFVGLFCPVNETPWEHLKLVFFPILFFTALELIIYGNKTPEIVVVRFIGAIAACIFIMVFFYLYTFILKTNYLVLDIASYYIGMALCYIMSYRYLKFDILKSKSSICASIIGFITGSIIFFIRTFK